MRTRVLMAFVAAGALIAAGARLRAVHAPEPPNPAADDAGWVHAPRREPIPDRELETLRAQLAEAEQRAKDAELVMASARAEVDAAREEVETAPNGAVSNDLIDALEAKVAVAEARAKEAEEEALRITPEANELRARLAQAAASKRFGPSG